MTNEEAIGFYESELSDLYSKHYAESAFADDYTHKEWAQIVKNYRENFARVKNVVDALREQAERENYGDEAEGRLNAICNANGIDYSDVIFLRELLRAWEDEAERDKGCPCCNGFRPNKLGERIYVWSVQYTEVGDGKLHSIEPKCCPVCGRPLKEAT